MRFVVSSVTDFPSGERMIVEIGRWSIGVFRIHDTFYAVRNRCPHAGGPLCLGRLQTAVESPAPGVVSRRADLHLLACPWHGWEYDIATGQSYATGDRRRAKSYPAATWNPEDGGQALVADERFRVGSGPNPWLYPGPYRLETFPITVDGEYVIVEVPAPGEGPDDAPLEQKVDEP